jgi:hypothetical protein
MSPAMDAAAYPLLGRRMNMNTWWCLSLLWLADLMSMNLMVKRLRYTGIIPNGK